MSFHLPQTLKHEDRDQRHRRRKGTEHMVDEAHLKAAVPQPHAETTQPPSDASQQECLEEAESYKRPVGKALSQTICDQEFSHRAS